MYPTRPPSGPRRTTSPVALRVSSLTNFQTPAKRLFGARTAAASGGGPPPRWAEISGVAMSPPLPITIAMTNARICLPSARRRKRVERHDVDPLDRVLPRQHAFDLHLASRI